MGLLDIVDRARDWDSGLTVGRLSQNDRGLGVWFEMRLSWNEIRARPVRFAEAWRDATDEKGGLGNVNNARGWGMSGPDLVG